MSQELPNISKIPQLNKAAFTNILDVFRERKIRVKPYTQGPYSLNLPYSKEPLKSKDFLYFLPLPLFLYSLNFPQTKEPNFLSLTFKETLKI